VGITLLLTVAANPPLSPRGQEYKSFVQELIPKAAESGGSTVLGVVVSSVNGVDSPTTFRIEGPARRLQSLRLAELAKEANLFDAIPSNAEPSAAEPIVEITITGADKRFFYRAKQKSLNESIAARNFMRLAAIYSQLPPQESTHE
jgi:hypothetical protein